VAMDRRLAGFAVLILAIVLAVVLGSRNDKFIAGVAVLTPLADSPQLGDCLIGPPVSGTYPAVAPTGPCSGRKYGEVVAVMPHSLPRFFDDQSYDSGSIDDPSAPDAVCARKGLEFLGLAYPVEQGPTAASPTWFPSTTVGPELLQPDWLGLAFGADWTACVVRMYSNTDDSIAYTGSLAQVHATHNYPPNAAICWPELPLNDYRTISCRLPHAVEEFGSMWDMDLSTRPAQLQHSCVDLVTEMTGRADPTAAGALQVRVVKTSTYRAADDQDRMLASYSCIVRAASGMHLRGPLLNLHDRPLPLR
jgi:hypothetical protein